jgi:type II secretory pathway pseudopilin PulG
MNTTKGFSLIESILYISIIGLVLVSFLTFGISIGKSRSKTYVAQEVQANMRTAIGILTERIRAADSVIMGSSVFDSDPGVLTLGMDAGAEDPTVFQLSADNGILQMTQAGGLPITITNDKINVTQFLLTNQTNGDSQEIIGIQMTMAYAQTAGSGKEYEYTTSTQTSISLRE